MAIMMSSSSQIILSGLLAFIILEAFSILALRFIYQRTGAFYSAQNLSLKTIAFLKELIKSEGHGEMMMIHSRLGWTQRPGSVSKDGLTRINNDGARADYDHALSPPMEILRICVYGDCLSFGGNLANALTWPSQLEQRVPESEVINFSVEGYGPCQMYMRYRESVHKSTKMDIAIMAVATSNVFKPVNSFRPFYSFDHGLMLGKPSFRLINGQLITINNPLPELEDYKYLLQHPQKKLLEIGQHDYYYQTAPKPLLIDKLALVRLFRLTFNIHQRLRNVINRNGHWIKTSKACKTTLAIIDAFCEETRSNKTYPVILIIPTPKDIKRIKKQGIAENNWVVNRYKKMDILALDVSHYLWENIGKKNNGNDIFDRNHLSIEANKLIADYLASAIERIMSKRADASNSSSASL